MADEVVRIKGKARKRRITFELEGVDGNVETFAGRPIPGWTYMEYWGDMADLADAEERFSDEAMKDEQKRREALKEAKRASGLLAIFEESIGDPDEFRCFRAFVRDPDNGIDMETLQEVFFALTDQKEDGPKRPPSPPASSRAGRQNTKSGSATSVAKTG